MKTTAHTSTAWPLAPVVLDLEGARPGLFPLARIAVLLETHGSLMIVNGCKSDNPGEQLLLLGQAMQGLGQSDDPRSAPADEPHDHFADFLHRGGDFCGNYLCDDCRQADRIPHAKKPS